jgi:deferrochelatase/peroxidase EfeB
MTEPTPPGAPVPKHVDPATSAPNPRRRAFLLGGLGAGAVGAVAGVTGGYAYRATRAAPASEVALENAQAGLLPPMPFEGKYQAGILPQPQRQTAVIAFNATAEGRGELTDLFRTITARARFLTTGGTPPPAGIGGPPPDSGVLGATVVPDGLTVTLGVGATLFDDR